MNSNEEMLTPEASRLIREKLSSMSIDDFTRDPRLIRIYQKYQKETGGTVEDFVNLSDRSGLPNWGETSARRLDIALEKLLLRIDAHLTAPTKEQAHCGLPPLDDDLANRLRKVGMDAITPIVRLNNCYADSLALSLYAFAYKTDRMSGRHWGLKSEKQFLDALNQYVSTGGITSDEVCEAGPTPGIDQDIGAFLKMDDDTLRYFYVRHFAQILKAIQTSGLDKMVVLQIAAEMNLKWPYKYRTRQLKEYLFEDKTQIFHTQNLGKKKIRTVILCLIWAAKGSSRNMDRFSEMSPDELMEASPLSANEKKALTLRFLGDEPRTLDETGRIMKVTRERVRQHQITAMAKLRTLGINQFALKWLNKNSSTLWALLSGDGGLTVTGNYSEFSLNNRLPGEYQLALLIADRNASDFLDELGVKIDDWWTRRDG
jgi:DNA-binding CsgD family transcriptional regulator